MKYTIQTKILTGFILGLMAIGLIGYQVHNQMTDLASSLYKKNTDKNNLLLFQRILSTLTNAESSVKTYSITNNKEDLDLFYSSGDDLDQYMDQLKKAYGHKKDYKYLKNNISSKIYLMHQMISLRGQNPSEDLLEEALVEIEKIKAREQRRNASIEAELKKEEAIAYNDYNDQENTLKPESTVNNEPKSYTANGNDRNMAVKDEDERKGFFERLFSRKKSKNDSEAGSILQDIEEEIERDTDFEVKQQVAVPEVDEKENSRKPKARENDSEGALLAKSLEQLKREKIVETAIWNDAMLALINEDTRITEEIRLNLSNLEKLEMDSHSSFIAAASQSKDRIISNTKIVGIGAFTIIFVLSFVVLHDFDKIRKNRKSLIDQKDKASRLAKVKEEFLANMSHEIRTPMNAIIGFAELMEKTKLNSQQQEYLSTIQQSSSHLLVILNDILDYSKLESGKLAIKKEPFNPINSISQVVKSMSADALKKNVKLEVHINEGVKPTLIGDTIRLQQILYNLISNAIKFTDKGGVRITANGFEEVESYILEVKVQDDGIGINTTYIDRIFENFEQVNTARERKYGGTGLGLAIVKRLVDIQNGSIHVKSKENHGSTFMVRIPYQVGEQRIEEKREVIVERRDEVDMTALKILAVDDQEYNLELIKIILKKWGAKVELATSGIEAVEKFSSDDYDLILMDVQMPQMSGLEATEKIRGMKSKKGMTIPIIALTAASTREETEKCLNAGMNDYLLKPFKQKDLKKAIQESISGNPECRPTEDSLKSITYNLEHLHALSNGNNDFIINMLEVFIKNTNHDLKQMIRFVEVENWKSAGLQAHKMIAPSRHLGIKKMVDILEDIERRGLNERDQEKIPALLTDLKNIVRGSVYLLEREIANIKKEEKIKQAS